MLRLRLVHDRLPGRGEDRRGQQPGARIDAGAASGRSGMWLLDPYDVEVYDGPTETTMGGNPNFVSDASSTMVSTTLINAALDANTSVSISTGAGGCDSAAPASTIARPYTSLPARIWRDRPH